MKKIRLEQKSIKFLTSPRLPVADKNRLDAKLKELENTTDPLRIGRKLKDTSKFKDKWRVRVGDYRIVYHIDGNYIIVSLIDKRPNIY